MAMGGWFLSIAMAGLVFLGVSYGPVGVAAAWIGIGVLILVVPLPFTCRALGVSYLEVLMLALKHLGTGLIMVGLVTFVLDPMLNTSPLVRLLLLISAGAGLYATMGALWFRPELKRTLQLVRR